MPATDQPSNVQFLVTEAGENDADLLAVHGITSHDIISAAVASKNGAYAAVGGSLQRPGNRWVALGDSITAGASDVPNHTQGEAWPTYASLMSGQRLHLVYNAGVFGNKTSDMIARFATDVTAYTPNVVTIAGGTNDYANSVTFSAFQANIRTLVGLVRALNAVPVICTIPPRDAGGFETTIEKWNLWLRQYAEAQGVTVLDFNRLLTDPANNHYSSTYVNDGIHPNVTGYADMGELAWYVLAPLVGDTSPMLPAGNTNTNNLLADGLFLTDGNANGVSDSWTPGSAPTGVTKSLVVDSAVAGQMQKIAMVAASGQYVLNQAFTTGWSVGDTLRFCGALTSDGGTGAAVNIHIIFTGGTPGSSKPLTGISRPVTRGVFCQDMAVPVGTTSIQFGLECGAASATAVVEFGQCAVWNLTTLGALT